MEILLGIVLPMAAAAIVWLVRLESKVQMNKRDVDDLKVKVTKMEDVQNRQEQTLAGGTERFKHIDETLTEIKQVLQKLVDNNAK